MVRPEPRRHHAARATSIRSGDGNDVTAGRFARAPGSWFDERLTVQYQRQYIDSAARFDAAPVPDQRQIEALDLFDEVVNEPGVSLEMNLERGDVQFVYNHSLLHDRTGFTDHADPRRRRHLLRLWLALPDDRELPPVFAERYGSVTIGDRGGIVLDETEPCIPIDV